VGAFQFQGAWLIGTVFNSFDVVTSGGSVYVALVPNVGVTPGTRSDVWGLMVPASAGVSSVACTVPSFLTVSGSPITSSGTLAITATGGVTGTGAVVLAASPTLTTPIIGTVVGPVSAAVNIRGGTGTTFAMAVQNTTGATNLLVVDNTGNITSVSSFGVTSAGVITGASVKLAGTTPPTIQNDGGGNVQIGTSGTQPSLTVGSNPFSAFSINPGTALVSAPTAGQSRRGITYGTDPAGDVNLWYNSSQTGAGYFFKDGNGGAVMSVPTGAGSLVSRTSTDTLTNKTLTSPTLVTPALGVATATSINGNTVPSASDTVALLAATQTLNNKTIGSTFQGLSVVDTVTSPLVFSAHSLLNTATASANFTTSATAGTYELSGYCYVSTAGTSGSVGLSFAFNNGASKVINSAGNANLGTLGSDCTIPTQVIQVAAATTIAWGASVTSGVGAFKYDVHLILRRIK
jgi:hypothetical protein